MLFTTDAIVSLGSIIFPPVWDLVRKKVLGRDDDSSEATLSTLARTKPEIMADYVKAMAAMKEAEVKAFQADISGSPAQWVVTVRAAIRPIGTALALLALILCPFCGIELTETTRYTLQGVVGIWFGTQISLGNRFTEAPQGRIISRK